MWYIFINTVSRDIRGCKTKNIGTLKMVFLKYRKYENLKHVRF